MSIAATVIHPQDEAERIPKDQYIHVLRHAGIDNIYFFNHFSQLLQSLEQIAEEKILLLNNAPEILFNYSYFIGHCDDQCTVLLTYCRNSGNEHYYFEDDQLIQEVRSPEIQYDAYLNSHIFCITHHQLSTLKDESELKPTRGIPCPVSSTLPPTPALFLDRDGVLIQDGHYVIKPQDAKIYPEIIDIIRQANKNRWYVFIITNQSGVARGFFSDKEVQELHLYLDCQLQDQQAYVNHWHHCPYFVGGAGEYNRQSLLRKPHPGMLLNACHRLPIDLNNSVMIGDKKSDIIKQPGVQTLLIQRSYELDGASAPIFFELPTLKNYLFK